MLNKLLSVFGLQAKESRALGALIQIGLDQPIWPPKDYESLTRVGYALNADVYACVNLIARSAKQVPWLVTDKPQGKAVKDSHPLLKLLRNPNERDTESDFKEAALAYLLLSGNTFVERNGGTEQSPPVFLYAHRPDRFRVVKGTRRQMIGGYEYKASGAETVQYQPWEIMHLRLFNPFDDYYGMSPIEAALTTIAGSNEASVLFKRLLQKGYPPGAVTLKGVSYSDTQIADLKIGLRRATENGDILLLQDAEWKEMGFKPIDASLFEGKLFHKRDIAAVYGVPSGMIGDTQVKTYANSREERRSLYTEAVIPALTKLRDGLNMWLSPLYEGAYIDIDKDAIDALAEDRETQAKRVVALFSGQIIKRSEAREELKYEAIPDSEDGYLADVGQAENELAQQRAPDQPGRLPQPEPSNSPRTTPRVGRPNLITMPVRRYDDGEGVAFKAFNLLSEEQKDNHWKAIEDRRALWYSRAAADIDDRFSEERNAVLLAFKDGRETAALRAVTRQEDAWMKLYKSLVLAVAEDFGRRTVDSIKADGYGVLEVKFELDLFTSTILSWLSTEGAKRVAGVLDTTKEKIRHELKLGVEANESIFDLSQRLQGMYLGFSNTRAERISRTEVISASNLGSQTAAKATNLPLEKEWIATYDNRTRDPHKHAHGQRQSMNEPYTVMGQSLMYPGDSTLGATGDNVINCRCSESYRIKRG